MLWLHTASGPMPIAAQINGRLYAIDSDHLNTPRRLTNTQGQVVWQWLITGYGEVAPTTGATGYAFEAPQLGGSSNTSGNVYSEEVNFKLRYPGQVWDEETGLSYNLNRYYDAQAGRYIQSDPIGLDGGWNRFGYVGADPLNGVDPTGLIDIGQMIAQPNRSVGGARYSYNPNDVRGGFDANGRSLAYNPRYYDPSAASKALLTAAMLIGPEFAAAGRAACTAAETIALYRAVGPEEFSALMSGGKFAFGPNGSTMKQFGFKLDEVLKYANWDTQYAAIIQTNVAASALKNFSVTFGQIDANIFRSEVVTVEGIPLHTSSL